MIKSLTQQTKAGWLFIALTLCLLSCDDQGTQPEPQQVQFSFSTDPETTNGRTADLPENSRLRLTVETTAGESVLTNHEVDILRAGDSYMADPIELLPGGYVLTDFMIVSGDELLYATPKAGSALSSLVTHAVPHNFSVLQGNVANINMQVIDGKENAPEDLGYASFSTNVINVLSVSVFSEKGGQTSLVDATGELRQGNAIVKSFSVNASTTTIGFTGEPDAEYTLALYTKDEAKVTTFNFKSLKETLGSNALKVTLEPAFILSLQSYSSEDWDDSFELDLNGAGGTIHINWGDGNTQTGTLPFVGENEYTLGTYSAIITGDLDQITDFWGFAYETTINAIDGLTNLTALKTYNPSWGAVPIHVDLSKCENLEKIFVEKFGAPYEPIDLRTDFKLPAQHFIKEFVFYVPSLEETREKVTTEELEVMVANIYNNVTQRYINNGRFIVTPVSEPSSQTQQMLNTLQNDYGWTIGLNSEDIYDYGSEAGRSHASLEARREEWLRKRSGKTNTRPARTTAMPFIQ